MWDYVSVQQFVSQKSDGIFLFPFKYKWTSKSKNSQIEDIYDTIHVKSWSKESNFPQIVSLCASMVQKMVRHVQFLPSQQFV